MSTVIIFELCDSFFPHWPSRFTNFLNLTSNYLLCLFHSLFVLLHLPLSPSFFLSNYLWIYLIGYNHSFHLIPVSPTVKIKENEVLGIVNTPITLNCEADGYPHPIISWTRGAHSIENQPGTETNEHQIKQTEDVSSWSGFYSWLRNLIEESFDLHQ